MMEGYEVPNCRHSVREWKNGTASPDRKDLETILSETYPFWCKLTAGEKDQILKNCTVASYQRGSQIHRSDTDCKGAMLVLSGLLRVYIVSDEGREVTLFRIRAGENCVLSASCLLDSIQFDVLIEAAEAVQAAVIPAGTLHPIMEHNPYVGLYIYKQAAERFSDVMWMMQQILFMGADRRVAIFLWDELTHTNQPVLYVTHDEIARNIGSAREVVSKVMKYLAEDGVVSSKRGKVEILDQEKLKKYLP